MLRECECDGRCGAKSAVLDNEQGPKVETEMGSVNED